MAISLIIRNLTAVNTAGMYKVKADMPFEETVVGKKAVPANVDITLNRNWSWIGYPASASNSINAAFADASPCEGDLVKSQTNFSIYTGGEWVGTLEAVEPGEGYVYFSNDTKTKTFHYATPAATGRTNARPQARRDERLNAVLGSIDQPYVLQLEDATAISDIAQDLDIKTIQL